MCKCGPQLASAGRPARRLLSLACQLSSPAEGFMFEGMCAMPAALAKQPLFLSSFVSLSPPLPPAVVWLRNTSFLRASKRGVASGTLQCRAQSTRLSLFPSLASLEQRERTRVHVLRARIQLVNIGLLSLTWLKCYPLIPHPITPVTRLIN